MYWGNKKVLVIGSGISGISASELLVKKGACVVLYDGNADLKEDDIREKSGVLSSVRIVIGTLPEEILENIELAVASPGVPMDSPFIRRIQGLNIPIWGEIELAYACGKGDVLGITGTNGKTTTTALLGEIMKAYKEQAFVVGNIGNPYTAISLDTTDESVIVAELSSFQLESVYEFHPKVSAILNVSPDHLDRHHTMTAYIQAKEKIAKNQTQWDTCVLNYEDVITKQFAEEVTAKVLFFSSMRPLEQGMYLKENKIVYQTDAPTVLCDVKDLKVLGKHNYENVMAASLMALAYGTPLEIVKKVILEFEGVPHRIEYVREHLGVKYYNDSKGTNPDAAIKGIQAMERPTFLIAGGYDKEACYREWIESFSGKIKKLILLGETKKTIASQAGELGFEDIIMADTLEEAILQCAQMAVAGEAVLLSPACASWDMFKNYEERGDEFKRIVKAL